MSKTDYLHTARRVFTLEAQSVAQLVDHLDDAFGEVVETILASPGRVVVCGMGKSGLIGQKIAATLASTGTPSFFMHPGEAYHGDLGMVTPQDIFLAISYSGETDEVIKLIPYLRDNQNCLVAMTGNQTSSLAKAAQWHLYTPVQEEACALKLAPTSSTTAALAMGDALAVALMEARGFVSEDFARFHPGGQLGRRLLGQVADDMQTDKLPMIQPDQDLLQIISIMSQGGLGIGIVKTDAAWGIITDGDLRRAVATYGKAVFAYQAQDLMTATPSHVTPSTRIEDALALMEKQCITRLLVIEAGELVGVFKK